MKKGNCPHCDSTGIDPDTGLECADCGGTGWIEVYPEDSKGDK